MKLAGLCMLIAITAFSSISCDSPLREFAGGNLKFTARVYNEYLKANANKNFVFSPFSIEVILALTRAGAKGITAQEFSNALNLPSEEATEVALKEFLPKLKQSSDNIQLTTANKLYLNKNFSILDSFKAIATGPYEAGIENVEFAKKEQSAKIINDWVEERTNKKIQNLISPSDILDTTRLILVNALYFKGNWQTPFIEERKANFYLSNTQTKEVTMMEVEHSFKYYESAQLNAKFLELPYVGENISMTIVLPNDKEGLSALEEKLDQLLQPQNLQYERVSVQVPTFLVESELKLKPILQNLGLQTIFSDNADLSGISKEPLKVSDVIQKAFINVTRTGTEAAAATSVLSDRVSDLEKPKIFVADHPFYFHIAHNGVCVFVGRNL